VLIGSGGVALLILILRALPQTSIWIAQLSNNVTGVSLEGRFWSLVRLVFTDNALLDASTRERIDLLSAAWFQFLSSPIFGQGFGAFAAQAVWAIQRGVFILRSGYAHADLFELAASTGLLGVGLYAGAILPSVKKVRHESWIWIGLVISLATGMVFRMLFDKAIWWILLVLVALLAKEKDHE
jgi:O-antigen ligase